MQCPSCGSPLPEGCRFCIMCGAAVPACVSSGYSAEPAAAMAHAVEIPWYPSASQTVPPAYSSTAPVDPGTPYSPVQPLAGGQPFAMPSTGAMRDGASMPRPTAASAFSAGAAAYDAAVVSGNGGLPAYDSSVSPAVALGDGRALARQRVRELEESLREARRAAGVRTWPKILLVAVLAVSLVLAGGIGSWLLFGAPLEQRLEAADKADATAGQDAGARGAATSERSGSQAAQGL